MELLSEVRTPQQVLNYAINRERERASESTRNLQSTLQLEHSYIRAPQQTTEHFNITKPQKATPCRKCGNPFSLAHL